MRRFLASILALCASVLLLILLLFAGIQKNFLDADFYLKEFDKSNLYEVVLKEAKKTLISEIKIVNLPDFFLSQSRFVEIISSSLTEEWLRMETEKIFQNFFTWFKSEADASDLKLVISFGKPKQQAMEEIKAILGEGSLINLIEDQLQNELDLLSLSSKKSEETQNALLRARQSYQSILWVAKLFWGILAVLIVFIVLLLIDSCKLIFRYFGKLIIGVGLILIAIIFALPPALTTFLSFSLFSGLPMDLHNILSGTVSGLLKSLMGSFWPFSLIFLLSGVILYLISFFCGKRQRRENI